MKERPILFSVPMVRAILDGHKTQTRRVVSPRIYCHELHRCPYGVPGDQLWVRETWDLVPQDSKPSTDGSSVWDIHYAAGGKEKTIEMPPRFNPVLYTPQRWRPSIHMPRLASRITLEVKDVRVVRVQDISRDDCLAEGIGTPCRKFGYHGEYCNCIDWFSNLWDSINAKRGFGWDVNPWVWVIEFERVEVGNGN